MKTHHRWLALGLVGLLSVVAGGATVARWADGPTKAAAPGSVRFDVPDTLAEVGRTRMIAFHLPAPAEADTAFKFAVEGGGLTVVREPEVLAGMSTGFLRVRGVRAGAASLRVWAADDARGERAAVIAVNVVPPRSPFIEEQARPVVDSPLSGSVVWGGFGASASWLEEPGHPRVQPRLVIVGRTADGQQLRRFLEPGSKSSRAELPTGRASFDVPELPPGDYELFARTHGPVEGEGMMSAPVRVRVIRPQADRVRAISAASLVDWARPDRWARGQIRVVDDRGAKGVGGTGAGKAVASSGDPPVSWTFTDLPAGWYQLMARVDGDLGAPAMPSLGLYIDGAQQAATATRVPAETWTRMPVGVPVRLGPRGNAEAEPGRGSLVTISPRLENPGERRGVRIDTLELVRLDDPGSQPMGAVAAGPREAQGAMSGGEMAPAEPMAGPPMTGGGDPMMGPAARADAGRDAAKSWDPAARQGPDMTGEATVPLRAGFARVPSGRVTGPLEVEVLLTWPGSQRGARVPPPTSVLLVNRREVAEQRSASPRFWIMPGQLVAGRNTVEVVTRTAAGHEARTGEGIVELPASAAPEGSGAVASLDRRPAVRLSVHEEAWAASFRDRATFDERARERRRAGVWTNDSAAELTLPAGLTGRYAVLVEGRAASGKGPVELAASFEGGGDKAKPVGSGRVNAYNDTVRLGVVDLSASEGRTLRLTTDHKGFADRRGEPAVAIDALLLVPLASDEAAVGPASARVVYPSGPGVAEMFGQDALVVDAFHPMGWARAELVVSGRPTGQPVAVLGRPGLICLPVNLRGLPAGEVELAARLTPTASAGGSGGPTITTSPVRVRVLDREPEAPGAYERAVRLLDRFGFGPAPADLAEVLTVGEEPWLRAQFAGFTAADEAALLAAVQRFPSKRGEADIAQRVIAEAALTTRPARARAVLWVENHFNTWVRKTDPDRKWSEHVRFLGLGAGPLGDLLLASATSPAMIHYLDQTRSVRGRLNENYAREIMELHTVGVKGGYTQADVTALARVLTGWTAPLQAEGRALNDYETRTWDFRFDASRNDPSPQRVFGLRLVADPPAGPPDAERRYERAREAMEMLACRPEAASFIARKLVESYGELPAPPEVVAALAEVYLRTNGDLAEMLVAMWRHPSMVAMTARPRLSWPLEYAVRLQRAALQSGGGLNTGAVNGYLKRARAGVFDWPTPDGMPRDDSAYADSNAMLQRWRLARELAGSTVAVVPAALRYAPGEPRPEDGWEQAVIDAVAIAVTGRLLGAESNSAALEALQRTTGGRDDRAREAAAVVPTLPEANLR